ncbi:MAG: hypothetical protein ABFS10_03620 [Bacteroidota bacterium]
MQRNPFHRFIFLLATGIILTSCHREYFEFDKISDEFEIEPEMAAPLVYGSMSMKDIVERFDSTGYVGEFDDGLIYLAYSDTLVEAMADTLVDVPDHISTEIYLDPEIDDPIFIGSDIGDTVHFYKSDILKFNMEGGDRVDSILVKGGTIIAEVYSSFRHMGFMIISSDQIHDPQGNPLFLKVDISDLSGDFRDSTILDSDHYHIETTAMGDSNVITIDYDLGLINSGNPINPGEVCDVKTSLIKMDFYGAYGYISSRELITLTDSLGIPIFADNPELTTLKLRDPRITIHTASSLGIPFEIELDSVTATAEDGSTETLEFYTGHPFVIPGPALENIGETVYGEININRETSNFPDLINLAPSDIYFNVAGRTHEESGQDNHFLLDTSRFMLEAEFLLPLDLRITGFALTDTMLFEMEEGVDTSMVRNAEITMTTINQLPIELKAQVLLLDSNYIVIDSVFEEQLPLLGASEVDEDGKLKVYADGSDGARMETHTVKFPAEKLGKLEQVSFMQVRAQLVTSQAGEPFVKIYSDYTLDFEISLFANFRINSNEL